MYGAAAGLLGGGGAVLAFTALWGAGGARAAAAAEEETAAAAAACLACRGEGGMAGREEEGLGARVEVVEVGSGGVWEAGVVSSAGFPVAAVAGIKAEAAAACLARFPVVYAQRCVHLCGAARSVVVAGEELGV